MPGKDYKPRVVTVRAIDEDGKQSWRTHVDVSDMDYAIGTNQILRVVEKALKDGHDVEVTHD